METKKLHLCKYSQLCWSTFGSFFSLLSFWIGCLQLSPPNFSQFAPVFSAVLLHQFGWRHHSAIFTSLQMFNQIPVWTLAWPIQDIHGVVSSKVNNHKTVKKTLYLEVESYPIRSSDHFYFIFHIQFHFQKHFLPHHIESVTAVFRSQPHWNLLRRLTHF